jgi:hypothetical protein
VERAGGSEAKKLSEDAKREALFGRLEEPPVHPLFSLFLTDNACTVLALSDLRALTPSEPSIPRDGRFSLVIARSPEWSTVGLFSSCNATLCTVGSE